MGSSFGAASSAVHEQEAASLVRRKQALGAGVSASITLALLAYFAYGGGYLTVDPMFSLLWGREIATGQLPGYVGGPTPHPLSNAVGAALAPLGRHSASGLVAISYLAVGALAYATGLIASRIAGVVAGVVAAALVLTRPLVMRTTAGTFVDIPFAALVMTALALELRHRRSGMPVLILLGIAGLLRPEAWFMSGLYWLWLLPGSSAHDAARAAVVAIAGPTIWLAADLLVTGDPLFSFNVTTAASASLTSEYGHGLAAVLTDGPRALRVGAQKEVGILAAVGLGLLLCVRRPAGVAMADAFGALALAISIPAAAGTLVNPRYALPLVALLCVLAGVAVGGWRIRASARPLLWVVAGLSALLLLVTGREQVSELRDTRSGVQATARNHNALKGVVSGDLPCRPLVVPNRRFVPYAAVWRATDRSEIADAAEERPGRATYLSGTLAAIANFVPTNRVDIARLPQPPRSARLFRSGRNWALYETC